MFEEKNFKLRCNQTTIDCNQFDMEILKNFFLLLFQTKTKRNEVFFRGGGKTKSSITKKRNVDIPSQFSHINSPHIAASLRKTKLNSN